jgi:hypothetical protein
MHRVFSPVAIELFGATCTAAPLPFISGDPWSVRNWDDINESFQRIRVFLRCKRNYGVFERQRCVSPGGVIPLFLMIMSRVNIPSELRKYKVPNSSEKECLALFETRHQTHSTAELVSHGNRYRGNIHALDCIETHRVQISFLNKIFPDHGMCARIEHRFLNQEAVL